MFTDKNKLRQQYKAKRKALNPQQREELSLSIANNCLMLPIWKKSNYHLFLSIQNQHEIDTSFLLNILQGKDKNVIVSKSNFKTYEMEHFLLTDNTPIKINAYGIPEPQSGISIPPSNIDVVFIPLLAYDNFGNRVGYGKGFYDRFLEECPKDCIKVGLSFFPPEKTAIATNENDIPLDFCITPEKNYSF